jgi:endonuclease/exonuclease/phosphatase (EEP) superfamily protein YafD
LRVVAFNVHWDLEGVDRIVAAVRPLEPDVLFMEEVLEKDLEEIGSRAGMSSGGRVQVFYSPRPPEGTSGTAIFARFPLSGGQFILPTGEAGEHGDWGHGAWAEATIDGQRVALACVHLTPTQGITPRHLLEREVRRGAEISSLLDFWRSKGSPPALFGGDFNQLPMGANYQALSAGFTDALAALGKTDWTCEFGPLHTRIDYLWLSPGWHAVDGEVVASDASDHRPIWARVRGGQ